MAMQHWTGEFPGLEQLEPQAATLLSSTARRVRLKAGERVFGSGQVPQAYVLVRSGDVRVSQSSAGGREIVLYRVMPGESCILTTACLLGAETYGAEAIAETDVEAIAIPQAAFDEAIAISPVFRRFVFRTYGQRVTDLIKLVDEIAFQRIDVRLAHKLIELAGANRDLASTHQQLAIELGTAREVISRQLHEFQRRGWVRAERGLLHLENRAALARLGDLITDGMRGAP